jgi:predicted regulator of Ras-like GTPase activity (Roadblock/LC7/MglB family)
MTEPLHEALKSLRDVEGVHGSVLLALDGRVLGRDLPAVVDHHSLSDAGAHIARLHEALTADGQTLAATVLRFADYRLHLRTLRGGYLAVLSEHRINAPTFRMALTLVLRRLPALLDATLRQPHEAPAVPPEPRPATSTPVPITVPSRSASPPVAPGSGPASRRQVIYRGRRIGS